MPAITTVQDLMARLGDVAGSTDPLAALRQRGFTIAEGLQSLLDAARPAKRLSPSERQRLAKTAAGAGKVRFRVVDRLAPRTSALPEGEWDFVAALRMDVLNEVLVALRAGFEFPREVTKNVDDVFSRPRLEALSDDVPSASARIGPLRLTGPLRLRAVGGTDRAIVSIPFSLVFLRSSLSGGPDVVVSSLRGVMTFGVLVDPVVERDGLSLQLGNVFSTIAAERLHIAVAGDSPIQPRSAKALATFEEAIDVLFRLGVGATLITNAGTVSPVIHLPIGGDDGAQLRVTDLGVRFHRADDGDVVMVGVRLATEALPQPDPGDPATLRNPFRDSASGLNAYVRVHEEVFRKLVKEALTSGALQDAARNVDEALRIDGADAEVRNNELRIVLDARIVDACFPEIDVNVRYTKTYRLSVFEGRFFVTEETDYDVADGDIVACFITASLQLILTAAATVLSGFLDDILRWLLPTPAGGQDNPFEVISAVYDPKEPVPGTEVLPRVEAVQVFLSNDEVESLGAISLRPDDVNTYIYAAFKRRSQSPIPRPATPIAGAQVEIIDQDSPIAPGDDATPPAPSVETKTAGMFETTTTVSVVPPQRNQLLASGTTNDQGQVKFVLTPSQLRTTAGTVVTVVTKEHRQTGDVVQTVRSERPFLEALPDVFFRVTSEEHPTFDTRLLEGGFLIDLRARRTGSPDSPLTFVTGRGPVNA